MSNDSTTWVEIEDAALAKGFTQIPNAITRSPNLSMQAKFLYGLLLSYAWQDPDTFPGLERMRKDTGAKVDTLRKYIQELVDARLLEVKRRGQGRTNRYVFKTIRNIPRKGGNKTTPNGGHQDNPQAGVSRPPREGGTTNTQKYKDSEDNTSNDVEGTPSPGQFVGYLREELDGSGVPLLRNREDRYAGEFNKLIKKGITEDLLYKVCDRIVERWKADEHRKLTAEQALEDVVNGKPPTHLKDRRDAVSNSYGDTPQAKRERERRRKEGYEDLFDKPAPDLEEMRQKWESEAKAAS